MPSSQQRVFISYSREDTTFVREVRERLIGMGHAPWMDLFDIPAGVRWPDAIDRALRSADVVLGVMSNTSLASDNVKNEWDWAIANRKRLVLLFVEPCEIPFHYVSLNYLDFTTGDRDAAYAQLGHALGSVTAAEPVPVSDGAIDTAPHPRPSRLRAALGRGPASRAVIVGRAAERDMLRQRVAQAIDGEGSLLLIGGEAGIGKTTLVTDIAREAVELGCLVLNGGCYDLSTTPPYGPWVQIVAVYQPVTGMPLVPNSIRDEAGLQSIPSQAALFNEVGEFFAEVAERQPLLLVLEDLHWSDPASLEFLRFLSRFLAGLPILVVVTYREDELTRRHPLWDLLPILLREAPAERLSLHRLDAPAIRELITTRYHLPEPDEQRLVDHLMRLAEGNPFFTRELLQSLEEDGALRREASGWALGDLTRADVPPLVRQVIERRLARLDDATRELLQLAAVIGHDVPYELWSAVSGADESNVLAAIEQAIAARLIEEMPDGQGVRFHHALSREALYEGIVSLRRRALHRRVADALIAAPAPVADVVAHHLDQCSDARLADWLVRAGEHAQRRWSWLMAAERFDRAQQLLENNPERAGQRAWLMFRTGLLWRFSRRTESLAFIEEAGRMAVTLGDRTLAAHALATRGLVECYLNQLDRGLLDMEAGLDAIDALPDGEQTVLTSESDDWNRLLGIGGRGTLAIQLANAGRYQDALKAADRDSVGEMDALDASGALGLVYAIGQGDAVRARDAFRRAHDAALVLNSPFVGLFFGLLEHLFIHRSYATEQVDERRQFSETASESDAILLGHMTDWMSVDHVRSFHLYIDGQWSRVRDMLRARDLSHFFWARGILGQFTRDAGEHDAAWQIVRQAFPGGPRTEPGNQTFADAVELQIVASQLALDAGDLDAARAWLEAHDRWMAWSGAVLGRAEAHLGWARYWWLSGDISQARQHANLGLSNATDPRQPLALIAAHRLLGSLDIAGGHYEDAEQRLRVSLELADACQAPFERALTLLAMAELEVARGRADSARALVAEVRAICEPLEARPTLERVAALEQRMG